MIVLFSKAMSFNENNIHMYMYIRVEKLFISKYLYKNVKFQLYSR